MILKILIVIPMKVIFGAKSDIKFLSENELMILLKDKFKSERGRINCSLWVESGKWRWLGIQYVIAEY